MTLETFNNWKFHLVDDEFIFVQSRRDTENSEYLTFAFHKGSCNRARQFFEVYTVSEHPQLDLLLDETLELSENGSPAEGQVVHIEPYKGGKVVLIDMGVYKNEETQKYYSYYNRFRVTITKHPLEETIDLTQLFDAPTKEWKLPDITEVVKRAEAHCKNISKPMTAYKYEPQKGLNT